MKISPSILACDFLNFGSELKRIEAAGADYVHFDVMDGIFVPNISFGIPLAEAAKKCTLLPLDVHLMISNPEEYVERFADLGCDMITFHYEACKDDAQVFKTLTRIRCKGKKAGIAIRPKTSAEILFPFLKFIDLALVMTVEPGFGGQKLIEETVPKIKILKDEVLKNNYKCEIEADGGITPENIAHLKDNGLDIAVAGSAVFKAENPKDAINKFKYIND